LREHKQQQKNVRGSILAVFILETATMTTSNDNTSTTADVRMSELQARYEQCGQSHVFDYVNDGSLSDTIVDSNSFEKF
jgi:hypothetical protein